MPTRHHSIFTGRMLFLTPNQQRQSTKGLKAKSKQYFGKVIVIRYVQFAVENYTTQYNIILTVNLWPRPLLGLVFDLMALMVCIRLTSLVEDLVVTSCKISTTFNSSETSFSAAQCLSQVITTANKKLSYRRGTARCVVSIEMLPIAMQQCRNYLYDKSWPNRWYEVGDLVGGNA